MRCIYSSPLSSNNVNIQDFVECMGSERHIVVWPDIKGQVIGVKLGHLNLVLRVCHRRGGCDRTKWQVIVLKYRQNVDMALCRYNNYVDIVIMSSYYVNMIKLLCRHISTYMLIYM